MTVIVIVVGGSDSNSSVAGEGGGVGVADKWCGANDKTNKARQGKTRQDKKKSQEICSFLEYLRLQLRFMQFNNVHNNLAATVQELKVIVSFFFCY